jgi:hypothetical protein
MNKKSEHEYLIVKIHHADRTTRYLRIERFGEDCIPVTTSQRSSPLSDSLKGRLAKDQISTIGRWPCGEQVLEKVDVRNANIALLDLAIAAQVVNTEDDQYKLLKRQCYWYSDMVMRVLEKAHTFNVDRSKSAAVEQAWLDEQAPDQKAWLDEQISMGGGRWGGVTVYKRKEAHVILVANNFRAERARVDEEVRVVDAWIFWRLIAGDRSA